MSTNETVPEAIGGACAWTGMQLARDGGWHAAWNPEELREIEDALGAVERRGLPWDRLTKDDFPLPATAERLADIAHELEDGRGFSVLSGLPVERFSMPQLRIIWMGICRHIGTPVCQDCNGQLMREIRDEGGDLGARHGQLAGDKGGHAFLSSKARTYGSGQLRFHTDRTDVVGLLTLRPAMTGGISRIASSVTVHNAMVERRPDLAALLYRPIARSRLGEESGGEKAIYYLPVFGMRDGKFTSHYSRTYIEAAQLLPEAPRMSATAWQALDLLAALAQEHCVEMALAPGDMQWLNNHIIYHARTPFEDAHEDDKKRHLLRLWLSVPNSRALPADHAVLWKNVKAGALRGGIGQDPV